MKTQYKQPENYKPFKGFYDLREYNLPKSIFQKLWDIQFALNDMVERQDYYKKMLPIQWEKAKEVSANYQHILFSYPLK